MNDEKYKRKCGEWPKDFIEVKKTALKKKPKAKNSVIIMLSASQHIQHRQ